MRWDTLFSDPHHLRGDLRLLAQAVRHDWPIPPDDRQLLVDRLDAIIAGDQHNHRVLLGAVRAAVEMVGTDVRQLEQMNRDR